jgi:6-phosphogluconolactonase
VDYPHALRWVEDLPMNVMTAAPDLREFDNAAELVKALATKIGGHLRHAISLRDHATLAVSGGRTPQALFDALSHMSLAWDKVIVTLCDERWVPEADSRSNTALVRGHLLQGEAARARFVPLITAEPTPERGLAEVRANAEQLPLPLDVVVLGMGGDGHTASWFPHGDHLVEALDPKSGERVVPMRAPTAPEARITLTAPVLASAEHIYLHIEGNGKRGVLCGAMEDGPETEMPIRAILRRAHKRLKVYWSP